mmetsp:Transcript_30332/g.60713  ORF Transcript_30332/g.60713 Transcript_30332/m.60713 type:complete len:95 (+) Transcript_30332:480-764(+)
MTFAMSCRSGITLARRVNKSAVTSVSCSSGAARHFASDEHKPTSFATKCASLYHPSAGANRGLAPPIYFGSTFLLDDADHGARLHAKKRSRIRR